jgi:hypothetical protein
LSAADAGSGQHGARRASAERTDPVAQIVFVLVVLACFAAFFITQRLKHTPTVVQNPKMTSSFSPPGPPPEGVEGISFRLSTADDVTVAILDSAGSTVATLVQNHPVPRYKQFSLRWNGRRGYPRGITVLLSPTGRQILLPRNTGPLAPAGEYRVRVVLHRQGREVLLPRSFRLVPR